MAILAGINPGAIDSLLLPRSGRSRLYQNSSGTPYLQLGCALQLMTVRFLGTFLEQPLAVPESVVALRAEQLHISDWSDLPQYGQSRARFDNRPQICERYMYKDFSEPGEQWSLMRWLYARAWHSADKPVVLFDLATLRLFERKVLLPGVTVLERLVARIADQASERLWERMARRLDKDQASSLLELLERAPDSPFSNLEMLHRPVLRQSGPGLVEALSRYDRLRSLGVSDVDFSTLPMARISSMAQQSVVRSPTTLRHWSEHHLRGTLLAFAWVYETRALDDALDLFDVVMMSVFKAAEEQGQEWQQQTRKELDNAALRLADICDVLVDPKIRNVSVRKRAYEVASRELIQQAIQIVRELARPPEERLEKEMVERYRQIVLFLPTLLRTLDFQATKGGQAVLKSLRFVHDRLSTLSKADFSSAPREGIARGWEHG